MKMRSYRGRRNYFMFITITTSRPKEDQSRKVEAFLANFLPRLKQLPGVVAIYHYVRPEHGDDTTLIIWENQEALKKYREGTLVQEAMAFEKELNLPSTREGYPLAYPAALKG
jgi:quinol monooxygenase YgiN